MPTAPPRLVVLGGTGFLGSAVTSSALAEGVDVTVVARHEPSGPTAAAVAHADLLLGDVGDPGTVEMALRHVGAVVFAVGDQLPEDSNLDVRRHSSRALAPLLEVLEALRTRPGVGLTLLSSGGTVYGDTRTPVVDEGSPTDPKCSYGVMHLAAEKYVGMYRRLYGVPGRVLRIANPYGPLQSAARGQGVVAALLDAVARGTAFRLFGGGRAVRDYVHVDDVASAVVRLTSLPGDPEVVNVGSGRGHTVVEVVRLVEEVTGGTVRIEEEAGRSFDVDRIVLDPGRLASLLPWDPRPLRTGIADTVAARAASPSTGPGRHP
jgi:UDP-glucose 4-epimerase